VLSYLRIDGETIGVSERPANLSYLVIGHLCHN
jgi:hypothetical protein